MKKIFALMLAVSLVLAFSALGMAQEKATPKEVVQKLQEAAQLIKEKGDDAYPILKDKNGPFIWKDCYIFVLGFDGVMRMHPINPKLDGRNMNNIKDTKGKMFNAEMVAIAQNPGQGWMEYYWIKPGAKEASPKASYIIGIPEKQVLIGAGVWDMSKDEADKAAK